MAGELNGIPLPCRQKNVIEDLRGEQLWDELWKPLLEASRQLARRDQVTPADRALKQLPEAEQSQMLANYDDAANGAPSTMEKGIDVSSSKVFTYIMKHDTGFAPHVDRKGRWLTLATCKPLYRKHRQAGDWVMGIAGSGLTAGTRGRFVWLARVSEEMNFDEYHAQSRFKGRWDNIYFRNASGKYVQDPKAKFHTTPEQIAHDLKVPRVLVCDEFYYLGGSGPFLQDAGFADFIPKAGARHDSQYRSGRVQELLTFAAQNWGANRWNSPSEAAGEAACDLTDSDVDC